MGTDKDKFTNTLKEWLEKYLEKEYSKNYDINVLIPASNISKLAVPEIKKVANYSSFEFKPDILAVLSERKTGMTELVFMNRSLNAISLKEIGEMHCYCKLSKPILAFISSPKGLPNEINLLLLNQEIEMRLLNYSEDRCINIFRWDEKQASIDTNSIFPVVKRK
jgi:hypothetical protein